MTGLNVHEIKFSSILSEKDIGYKYNDCIHGDKGIICINQFEFNHFGQKALKCSWLVSEHTNRYFVCTSLNLQIVFKKKRKNSLKDIFMGFEKLKKKQQKKQRNVYLTLCKVTCLHVF